MKLTKLRITKSDAAKCKTFRDNSDCLAATAAKRQFKTDKVLFGGITATINGVGYSFCSKRIHKAYRQIRRGRKMFKPFVLNLRLT